jgi:hypothetical protein
MSDWIKNLFLVRHAESEYNVLAARRRFPA